MQMSDRPPAGKAEGGKKSGGAWGFLKNALSNVSVELNVGPSAQRAPSGNPTDPAARMEPVRQDRKETYDEMIYRTTDGRDGQAPMVRVDRERQHVARSLDSRSNGADGAATIPQGGGAPLPDTVRQRMAPRLGADLAEVRVHTGGDSAAAAQGLNAKAFTTGRDVHFAAGQFNPGTPEGDRLIAHELTHTVQAQRSGVQRKADEHEAGAGGVAVSHPDEQPEKEADEVADHVTDSLHGKAEGHAAAAGGHGAGAGEHAAAGGHGGDGKSAAGGQPAAATSAGAGEPASPSATIGAANGDRAAVQRKPISASWVGVGSKIHRRPASAAPAAGARPATTATPSGAAATAGASAAAAAAGPAGAAPAGPVEFTEKTAFAMSGEAHTLTAHYKDGALDVTMASMPRQIQDAINLQRATEQALIPTLHGPAKAEREGALAALNDLESWFNGEEAKIKAVTDPAKRATIGADLKALVTTLKTRVVSVVNTYKMKDFVAKSFGIDQLLTTLDNQVNKELRKHVGAGRVLGDGHNNTATAAEILNARTNNGVAVPYLAAGTQHQTRTTTCLNQMEVVITRLDEIEADFGVHVSAEPLYKEAQKEIAGCKQALTDARGYLAAKGFQVVAGDFKPL
jgi:hypothetical protein